MAVGKVDETSTPHRPDRDGSASPIAIVGMACRFPGGATSPDRYWQLLTDGIDATTAVPPDRWSGDRFFNPDRSLPGKAYVHRGGFLREGIDTFDASFFGLSPREATLMDPQQRLLLEVAWESFEDSGIVPNELRGSSTGIYIGGFTMDNQIQLLNVFNRDAITTHTAIGSTMGMLANRLSYTFDFHGPSLSVDTACSSSLVALHLACQGLQAGECELAIVGGVNVMLRPEYMIALSKGGFLSPDGLCKAFDAAGDGYVRGEGAGIVILKPLHAALRDGDRIRAIVAATGVNQDGRTDGITVPNGDAQRALLRAVQSRAGIGPDQIQYIEAHGTGTRAGDLTETASLGQEIAARRTGNDALWIGSVKTNIGHLEAAAGVAGLIKTVLAIEHRLIPPNLHFHHPHPEIDFAGLRLRVPVRPEAWPEHTGPACAAVNSFGYGGTNAHAILTEPPPPRLDQAPPRARPAIFPLSAASGDALTARVEQFADFLETRPELALEDLGHTAARRRTHHTHRLGLVAWSAIELASGLRQLTVEAAARPHHAATQQRSRGGARMAFVYTGMGPQFYGMGMDLLEQEAAARELFARCDRIWSSLARWSLENLFRARSGEPMTEPAHAQPANFVLQLMLTEVAKSYGLYPDGVVGHSVGEIAAACAGGSLSLEDALELTYHRSRLQQRLVGCGKMLAIALSIEETLPLLKTVERRATVAAINSPTSVTVAGDSDAIVLLNEVLTMEGIFSRVLNVDVPYHSHRMDPLSAEFESSLAGLTPKTSIVPTYSTVTGVAIEPYQQNTSYWWCNARQPVRFADAVAAMINDGFDTFVEVGPHPVLSAAIDACLLHAGVDGECVGLQRRGQPEIDTLLDATAQLYATGVDIDWSRHYPSGTLISLPTYPWDRERLWSETQASRADRIGSKGHPLLVPRLNEPVPAWEGELSSHIHPYLSDHQVQDERILPAAAFVEMGLLTKGASAESVAIEDLTLHRPLAVDETPFVRLLTDDDGGRFRVFSRTRDEGSRWMMNASARLLSVAAPPRARPLDRAVIPSRFSLPLDVEAFYQTMAGLGLRYGPAFRCLREAAIGDAEILSRIELSPDHADDVADYYLHPTLLDAALQTLLALAQEEAVARQVIFLPVEIGQIRFQHKLGTAGWCHASLTRQDHDSVEGDLVLYDDQGQVSAEILRLRARAVKVGDGDQPSQDNLVYRTDWHVQRATPGRPYLTKRWLVFCDAGQVGAHLVREAHARRVSCVTVQPGAEFRQIEENSFEVRRECRQDIARLVSAVGAENLDGIVYLWGLDIPECDYGAETRPATGLADVINLLHIIQELERCRALDRLTVCIATARAQAVIESEVLSAPGQHALLGVGRVLAIERPEVRLKMVDLNSRQPIMGGTTLLDELLGGSEETEVAFRSGSRFLPRVVPWDGARQRTTLSSQVMRYGLNDAPLGSADERGFHEVERRTPGPGEVEIAVHLRALAPQDGMRNGGERPLPSVSDERNAVIEGQVAGVVVAVGDGVARHRPGDAVVVLTPCATFTSHVTVAEELVIGCPRELSLEQSLALIDWALAHYVLFEVGALDAGQSVLIHGAEGGLGWAAIQLARLRGATVFATAATAVARDRIRELGVEHVSDALSLRFVDDLATWTARAGVDVAFCPVSGEIREMSLGVVADSGQFIDVAVRPGAASVTLPIAELERGLRYSAINPSRLGREQLGAIGRTLTSLASLVASGRVQLIDTRLFPVTQLGLALRELTNSEQVCKIVIDLRDRCVPITRRLPVPIVNSHAGYLVTGGFGGFGLETLKWLAGNGARHIAVLSRSGPASEEARETVSRLEADGVQVLDVRLDMSDQTGLAEAMRQIERDLPPLRGIIHAAAIVDDAPIETIQDSQVEGVFRPKAVGALNLHRALAGRDLDFFACYSSVTALLGNEGQASYAAANAFLDGLVLYRRSCGLPGVSINWGVLQDVGMVSRDTRVEQHLERLGLRGITPERALEVLELALREEWDNVGVVDIDWEQWHRQTGGKVEGRLLTVLAAVTTEGDPAADLRRRVSMARPDERLRMVYTEVAEQVCRVLRIHTSRVDPETNLTDIGIDSLMATELALALEERTGLRFRVLFVVRGPTLAEMSREILDYLMRTAA